MYLSSKMVLFNLLAKGVILSMFFISAPFLFNHFALKNTDLQLDEKKEQVLSIIKREGMSQFFSEEDTLSGFGSYNILKEEYILLEKIQDPEPLDTIYNRDRILENERVPYRVRAYMFSFQEDYFLLEIGRSLGTIKDTENIIYKILLVTFWFFLMMTFFLDIAFNKRLIEPFRQIIHQKLSQIDEPQQFPYQPVKTSTIDFQLLDSSISEMMKRIQKSFNQERVFISHASHELKTPISVLQSQIESFFSEENLSDKDLDRLMEMQSTVQKFKKTVNSLLLLSKVNNAQFLKSETVDIALILEDLFEEWESVAEDKSIDIRLLTSESFQLKATNISLCTIMLQNVLINAIKYTPSGGSIEMSGTPCNLGYRISIKDTGPGISPELMEQVKTGIVFLKDAKVDRSGFGLQIIFKIALYLGIEIEMDSGEHGTEFNFCFHE
ncbi:MAG: HAMP domain-containing sensor histidine kinase [Anditalea sp.]